GNGNARDEVLDLVILESSGRGANDQAAQAFRTPRRIIERGEAAAGDADQMEFIEREMIRERIEIAGDTPRLRTGNRIGQALAPTPAIERDDPVAGLCKADDLRFPD